MGILNRWRQLSKRYFWPHLLLGVVAASIGVPSILVNAEQQALSSTATSSVNRLSHPIQSISDSGLWHDISRQSVQSINPWHQQAIRRFLTRLALVITPRSSERQLEEVHHFQRLSLYEWAIVDSIAGLLSTDKIAVSHQNTRFPIVNQCLTGLHAGLWLVKLGGLRAGPFQYF